jgi:hypothetical protein
MPADAVFELRCAMAGPMRPPPDLHNGLNAHVRVPPALNPHALHNRHKLPAHGALDQHDVQRQRRREAAASRGAGT